MGYAGPGMRQQHLSFPWDAELQFDKHSTCRALAPLEHQRRHLQAEKRWNIVGNRSVPPQERTATQILIKWRAGYDLHPNQADCHLNLSSAGNWTILSRFAKVPSPELEKQSCHLPPCLPSTWGQEERTIQPPPSQCYWLWKWAFSGNRVEKAISVSV